jgi:hypothetical protein
MDTRPKRTVSPPDSVIAWTTAAGLVFFGIIFFDDSVIMGRTILTLGLLSVANEALKLRAGPSGADYSGLRLALALAYLGLVVMGFVLGSLGL